MDAYIADFLMGAITLGWLIAALFFVRFWREAHDRLFLLFAVSFVILASTRIVMVALNPEGDEHSNIYWLRLVAYCLIFWAIVDKNLRAERSH